MAGCVLPPGSESSTGFGNEQGLRNPEVRRHVAVSQLVAALKECTKKRDLQRGKEVHRDAIEKGLHTDKFVGSSLITMYSKCRNMASAQQVFDSMTSKNVFNWNSLIRGYVENSHSCVALNLFTGMDCEPDCFTYIAALKACCSVAGDRDSNKQEFLDKGISIHKQLKEQGFDSNVLVANTLLHMYLKCGSLERAKELFLGMVSRDVVTWNTVILGFVENGESLEAMSLFAGMDCEPDAFTYAAVLKGCAALVSEEKWEKEIGLQKGIAIHKQVRDHGFEHDSILATALLDMYCKCGSMQHARELFDSMARKRLNDWNVLALGYAENGHGLVALDLLSCMNCEPDSFTYVAGLKACATLASEDQEEKQACLMKGVVLHKQVRERGLESHKLVANVLLNMYCKCGKIESARSIFDNMVLKDVISWNCMILGYAEGGDSLVALDLLAVMDCEPDSFTYVAAIKACTGLASESVPEKGFYLDRGITIHRQAQERGCESHAAVATSLISMYGKFGCMVRAREVFDAVSSKNAVIWTALITGYAQSGQGSLAMEVFNAMDVEPSSSTYTAVLKACGSLSALATGQQIHARVCSLGLEQDQLLLTTLLDFYGRCGSVNRAQELFNSIQDPDIIHWNALITGYSFSEDPLQVFSLVKQMQEEGLQGDSITFNCVLTACSQAGQVEKGILYFRSMLQSGICPDLEHYTCLIDMLGRANRLKEAVALMNSMPFEADAVAWTTLLGACTKWKNLGIGEVAFDALASARTTVNRCYSHSAAYVLMSEIYRWPEYS